MLHIYLIYTTSFPKCDQATSLGQQVWFSLVGQISDICQSRKVIIWFSISQHQSEFWAMRGQVWTHYCAAMRLQIVTSNSAVCLQTIALVYHGHDCGVSLFRGHTLCWCTWAAARGSQWKANQHSRETYCLLKIGKSFTTELLMRNEDGCQLKA